MNRHRSPETTSVVLNNILQMQCSTTTFTMTVTPPQITRDNKHGAQHQHLHVHLHSQPCVAAYPHNEVGHDRHIASYPGPAQLSITSSTVKRERAWAHVSDVGIERVVERVQLCVGALGPEQQKEPRYQVTYHTYLASGRQLSYTPSVKRVVN